jgi:pimeloyl-ACP methyl ester carboxylesterase
MGRAAYCSWCFQHSGQHLEKRNIASRNVYRCGTCGQRTLECRYCKNMARGTPSWDDECCAEHDGSIASFKRLRMQLRRLEDYEKFIARESWNMVKAGKVGAIAVGTAALVTPIAWASAPSIAASLGSVGVLGAAGTGTAISSLSGAALSSASLAAVGMGYGVAGGAAVLTAAGAGLGAYQGGALTHAYARDVADFRFVRQRKGAVDSEMPTIITIDGFLTQKSPSPNQWRSGLNRSYGSTAPWYHLTWESKTLYELGKAVSAAVAGAGVEGLMRTYAKRATKAAAGGIGNVLLLATIARNPFWVAMNKAAMAGAMLADVLARTRNPNGFILIGHSLGARLIFYALQALSTREALPLVREAVLLGGAVGIDKSGQKDGWRQAAAAVEGKIHNFYSHNDDVLAYAYKAATLMQSAPIGIHRIGYRRLDIVDHDVTKTVRGHNDYKRTLTTLFDQLGSKNLVTADCPYCAEPLDVEDRSWVTHVCPSCEGEFRLD